MDGFVQKYDATGTLQWTNSAAGVGNDKVTGLSIGGDGAVYLSGSTTSSLLDDQTNSTGMETSFLSKIQSDGTKVYTKLLGTVTNDVTPEYSPEIFPIVNNSGWTTVVPSTSTLAGTNSLPVAGTGEFISTTVTGTGDLQGTPANTHYYTSEITIDTSAYPNGGTIQIEIQLGNGASAANYDLFADTVTLPSLVLAYDVVPGTTTTLSWTFEAGDTSTYVLAIEGSSGSISDTNTFSYSVTTGTTPKSLTFNPMSPFQTVSVGGLSFTSNTTLTAAQVASAFANLTDGATADSNGEVADSAGNSLGSFSGTLTGLSTSESADATITTSLNPSQTLVVSGAPVERKTVTFQDLSPFQTVSVAGLSFTPNTTLTAAQVATAFANLSDGATADSNGEVADSAGNSLGSFSGTLTGLSTSDSTAGSPTITTSLSTSESIVVGVTPTTLHTLQFYDMSAFQTIRVAGLSFTSNTSLTAAQVASAFANLTDGATADSDSEAAESTGNSLGSFSGTLDGFSTATNNADSSQIIINISSPPITDNTFGIPAYQMLEFKDMNPFQTVTISGLAFTSNTYLTAAQVALAFSNLSEDDIADDDGQITGSAGNVLGTFKGTLVGLSTGSSKTDSPVLVTSTANSISVSGTQPIGVDATPVLTTEYLTFPAMENGKKITVAGLSFVSNIALTAQDVAEMFSDLADGSGGNLDATKGAFTGSFTGFSTGSFTDGSAEVLFTQTSVNSQVSLTSTALGSIPTLSNPTLTFFALVPNQKVSVGGLEFTARKYLTATEVASAFANLSEGDTGNSTGTLLGSYSGALQGFNTSANDIADVIASRTATAFAPIVISTLNSSGAALAENFSTTVTVTQPAIDISSNSAASNSISQIDIALEEINNIRAGIGSYINNLMYASDNNTNNLSNLTTSRSTIMDTDYATETANLVKNQIIDQAATAILAQANQESKYVLQLLKKV